jgi:hypothetical protein
MVLVSRGPITSNISYPSNILNVSYSEEGAWTSIDREINSEFTKNKFRYPCIRIYPELKIVRLTVYNGTGMIHTQYIYRIIRKHITDPFSSYTVYIENEHAVYIR